MEGSDKCALVTPLAQRAQASKQSEEESEMSSSRSLSGRTNNGRRRDLDLMAPRFEGKHKQAERRSTRRPDSETSPAAPSAALAGFACASSRRQRPDWCLRRLQPVCKLEEREMRGMFASRAPVCSLSQLALLPLLLLAASQACLALSASFLQGGLDIPCQAGQSIDLLSTFESSTRDLGCYACICRDGLVKCSLATPDENCAPDLRAPKPARPIPGSKRRQQQQHQDSGQPTGGQNLNANANLNPSRANAHELQATKMHSKVRQGQHKGKAPSSLPALVGPPSGELAATSRPSAAKVPRAKSIPDFHRFGSTIYHTSGSPEGAAGGALAASDPRHYSVAAEVLGRELMESKYGKLRARTTTSTSTTTTTTTTSTTTSSTTAEPRPSGEEEDEEEELLGGEEPGQTIEEGAASGAEREEEPTQTSANSIGANYLVGRVASAPNGADMSSLIDGQAASEQELGARREPDVEAESYWPQEQQAGEEEKSRAHLEAAGELELEAQFWDEAIWYISIRVLGVILVAMALVFACRPWRKCEREPAKRPAQAERREPSKAQLKPLGLSLEPSSKERELATESHQLPV